MRGVSLSERAGYQLGYGLQPKFSKAKRPRYTCYSFPPASRPGMVLPASGSGTGGAVMRRHNLYASAGRLRQDVLVQLQVEGCLAVRGLAYALIWYGAYKSSRLVWSTKDEGATSTPAVARAATSSSPFTCGQGTS